MNISVEFKNTERVSDTGLNIIFNPATWHTFLTSKQIGYLVVTVFWVMYVTHIDVIDPNVTVFKRGCRTKFSYGQQLLN